MQQVAALDAADIQVALNARSSFRPRPLPQFLIANPRLESSSNNRKQTHLRISNRERMAVSARNKDRTAGAIAHVSIFANGGMLAPSLNGHGTLSASNVLLCMGIDGRRSGPRDAEQGLCSKPYEEIPVGPDTSGPAERRHCVGSRASHEAVLRFETIARAETRIAKKEKCNGRSQQSH